MNKSARIGTLEVRRLFQDRRTRVVKFPGNNLKIEHFFPQNHIYIGKTQRATFIRSRLGSRPRLVKKEISRNASTKLEPISEARLATYINGLKIRKIRAEVPLAAIMHINGNHSVIYRHYNLEDDEAASKAEKEHLKSELRKHGVEIFDAQWVMKRGRITLYDIEQFQVSEELKKKLGLKYVSGEAEGFF